MGNSNSGRYGGKAKCEQFLFVDVRLLARKKILKAGNQITWSWSNGCNMGMTVYEGWIDLQYTMKGQTPSCYPVYLSYTDCNYGGQRPWFLCPICGGRNAKLFLRNGRFSCRSCHKLVYRTQVLDTMGRNQRAYGQLRSKLRDGDMKPKGMHWRTFEQLHDKMEIIDGRINQAFNFAAMRFFNRIGMK
jgi:hypothetical protein